MTSLEQQFKRVPERECPEKLHGEIMTNLLVMRFKWLARNILILLCATLLASGWHIWLTMAEIQGLSLLRDLVAGFRMDFLWITDFLKTIIQFYPVEMIFIFFANLLAVGYLIHLLAKVKRTGPAEIEP